MSLGSFLLVITSLLLVGVLLGGIIYLGGRFVGQVMRDSSALAVEVVVETVKGIGPMIAQEVGDQIRGYPMGSVPQAEEPVQQLDEVPSWFQQATAEDDERDNWDPTDLTVADPVDWSPEGRVAGMSELPVHLRGVEGDS